MAIGFARIQFVQRSKGQNVCCKSAYIGREKIHFNGNEFLQEKTYSWNHNQKVAYNEVLLPDHVSEEFKNPEKLWNLAESSENRKNSNTAIEFVFALPDDLEVTLDQKIKMIQGYVRENYIKKGLAAQVVIHPPEEKGEFNPETGEIENYSHNWHSHVLLTTRRFTEDGIRFDEKKARDMMPVLRSDKTGKQHVVLATNHGKSWGDYQNEFFEENGLSVRVDPNGLVSQSHLGPVRLRGRALAILEKNNLRKELNREEIKDPSKLISSISKNKNIFTRDDVSKIVCKYLSDEDHEFTKELIDKALSLKEVVELLDPDSNKPFINPTTGQEERKYTTVEVLAEEKRCLILADRIHNRKAYNLNVKSSLSKFGSKLNPEQSKAFDQILRGSKLSCIDGYAGTGKSYLLVALKEFYESEGFTVRAFGPDSATAQVLKDKGISLADNVYNFLFKVNRAENNSQRKQISTRSGVFQGKRSQRKGQGKKEVASIDVRKGKEVWLIDETTKLGNRPMLQILKFADKYDAQVVFSGGSSQLLPVERGCLYEFFCKRYGAHQLGDIQRQKSTHHREIAKKIASGEMGDAINRLASSNNIIWIDSLAPRKKDNSTQGFINENFGQNLIVNDRKLAVEELVKKWASDREAFPASTSTIIATSNLEIKTINELVRTYRKERGEISKQEFKFETDFGEIFISQGDIIEFGSKNSDLGVNNGTQGSLVKVSPDSLTILIKDNSGIAREVVVNPSKYAGFKLGYATTCFRSQGKTIDRAYVLHSVNTNRELFYVGLTRHVKNAYFFVPKSNMHFLSYLKAKAHGFDMGYREYLSKNKYFRDKDTQFYLQNLSDQVSLSQDKNSTPEFISSKDLRDEEKKMQIKDLIDSSSRLERLKGYSLSAWSKVGKYFEDRKQERKEQEFFSPSIKKSEEKDRIQEIPHVEPSDQEHRNYFISNLISSLESTKNERFQGWNKLNEENKSLVRDYLVESRNAWCLYNKVNSTSDVNTGDQEREIQIQQWEKSSSKRDSLAYKLVKDISEGKLKDLLGDKYTRKLIFEASRCQSSTSREGKNNENSDTVLGWQRGSLQQETKFTNALEKILSEKQKKIFKSYQEADLDASTLKEIVKAEKENGDERKLHHAAWQAACGKRNAAAYELAKSTPKEKLSMIVGDRTYEFILEQSNRYERLLHSRESRLLDLDSKLKENLDSLLFRLFPEGPISKSRGEVRYGSKGSLVVKSAGDKIGTYYNFEEGKGGGPIQLIESVLRLSSQESRKWATEFIGLAKDIIIPEQLQIKKNHVEQEKQWISIRPDSSDPAPSLKNIANCKLHRYFKEEDRYPYHNEKGELLFYTVRLVDKTGKKSVLPLSYGVEKGEDTIPHWSFQGYASSQRPLYNLQLLKMHPTAKVVIVEGEKTANAANKLLNQHGMICLTWLGGASATSKTNWSPLIGRDVLIWPDNDQAGFDAAKKICSELRKLGTKSLRVVDEKSLEKTFPPKWDLADPIPKEKRNNLILSFLLSANEKSVDVKNLSFALKTTSRDTLLMRAREVLWRVEERIRPELERRPEISSVDISNQVVKETANIFSQVDKNTQKFKELFNLTDKTSERLAFQVALYKAETGKDMTSLKIQSTKEIVEQVVNQLPGYKEGEFQSREGYLLAIDKTLSSIMEQCDRNIRFEGMGMTFNSETNSMKKIHSVKDMNISRQRQASI